MKLLRFYTLLDQGLIGNLLKFNSQAIGQLLSPDSRWAEQVTNLVNEAYALGESGMWLQGTSRTHLEEVKENILQKKIIVAFNEQSLLGAIKITKRNDSTLEFGQLAVSKSSMKNGVGKQLIQYVENHARQEGFLKIMLEILYPAAEFEKTLDKSESVDMIDPAIAAWKKKALLHQIYSKMNYKRVNVGDMSELALDHPKLVNSLAVPCKYVVYEKLLGKQ